jgi:hypothetical protein
LRQLADLAVPAYVLLRQRRSCPRDRVLTDAVENSTSEHRACLPHFGGRSSRGARISHSCKRCGTQAALKLPSLPSVDSSALALGLAFVPFGGVSGAGVPTPLEGLLKLSSISCPIALYPAISAAERISVRQVNRRTDHRLKQKLVDSVTGQAIDSTNKARGDEVGETNTLAHYHIHIWHVSKKGEERVAK